MRDFLDTLSDQERAVLTAIALELRRAQQKHGKMRGPHEGYAVLLEEVDELWDDIKANKPIAEEAIQVGAMAARMLLDVSGVVSFGWLEENRRLYEVYAKSPALGNAGRGDARALAEDMPRDIIAPAAKLQAEKDFNLG